MRPSTAGSTGSGKHRERGGTGRGRGDEDLLFVESRRLKSKDGEINVLLVGIACRGHLWQGKMERSGDRRNVLCVEGGTSVGNKFS